MNFTLVNVNGTELVSGTLEDLCYYLSTHPDLLEKVLADESWSHRDDVVAVTMWRHGGPPGTRLEGGYGSEIAFLEPRESQHFLCQLVCVQTNVQKILGSKNETEQR